VELPLARLPPSDKKTVLMRHAQMSFISRCTALLCAVAWFVASNHCALAGLLDRMVNHSAVMNCEHCPTKDGDGGKSGAPMSACCKGIKATTSATAKVSFAPVLSDSLLIGFLAFIQLPEALRGEGSADTGPPRGLSFAEAVLSRSFQSHAPPIFG
jgi:hypothetical protein